MKIVIIGSGIAGIAAAIRLGSVGHDVHVFEANAYPGGKLTEIFTNGYRFDAGPSLFTMPNLVQELIAIAGCTEKFPFAYSKLERICHYFYSDGTKFVAFSDPERFLHELHKTLGIHPDSLRKYLLHAKEKYEVTSSLFVEESLHRWKRLSFKKVFQGILKFPKLNLFSSMNDVNKHWFKAFPKLVQYFNRFATYNGSNPYQAPGLLAMISHLEHGMGSYFPKKGMHQITDTLVDVAKHVGVQFHFNQKVDQINVKNGRATGVTLGSTIVAADVVVSNMDIHPTYRKLLPGIRPPLKILKQEKSSSALIFYWGINRSFPELDLHNVFFSADYKHEFNCIFNGGTFSDDPTVYVNITSKYQPSDAPLGHENWFVMINVAHNDGSQDWNLLQQKARNAIIEKLSRMLEVDLKTCIASEDVLDPVLIEQRTSSFGGSLYGNSSNSRFSAFLRHKNFSSDIAGLYFCGGSVHPGGGIPLCLNSAKIVSELIKDDHS